MIESNTVYKYDSNGNITGKVTAGTAPCILMTPFDHGDTSSYKSSNDAKLYRAEQADLIKQGLYMQALYMDVAEIKKKFGGKYNNAINQAIVYAQGTLHWYK